jgi:hypothetical protein
VLGLIAVGVKVGLKALDAWVYSIEDPITQAEMDTNRLLRDYSRTGDPKPVAEWLTSYQGEAPGSQVMATLGKWAPRHQRGFVALFESISPKERRKLFLRLHHVMGNFGLDDAFWTAFRNYRSPVLEELRNAGASQSLEAATD